MSFSRDKLIRELRSDEGEVLHAYEDHLGYITIGVGRLIDKRKGGGISKKESAYLLQNDIEKKARELFSRAPWITSLDDVRQRALLNMAFQLGVDGLLGFKNTLRLIDEGKYEEAADNALQSKWARQTPNRAKVVTEMIRTGKDRP